MQRATGHPTYDLKKRQKKKKNFKRVYQYNPHMILLKRKKKKYKIEMKMENFFKAERNIKIGFCVALLPTSLDCVFFCFFISYYLF